MKNVNKLKVRKLTDYLEQAMPFMVLFMVIYFGLSTLQFQGHNRILLERTKTAAENTEVIIKNLEKGIEDIKKDNQRNTDFLNCLLAAHDVGVFDIAVCTDTAETMNEQRHNPQPAPAPHTEADEAPAPSSENSGGAGTPPPPPQEETKPLLFPGGEGLIRDSVPILGRL